LRERIHKIISAAGIASLREAEKMISCGRVCVNGVIAQIGESADISVDQILVDDEPIQPKQSNIYIMLNKPRGYITTMTDDRGRPTILELTADIKTRIYPVGRLDMDSEGLILMTNDGHFSNQVMHPSNGYKKKYEVCVFGDVETAVQALRLPMNIEDKTVKAVSVEVVSKSSKGGVLRIEISQGLNRQIRKMCLLCKLKVRTLKRISIGKLSIGNLKCGSWRHLSKEEVGYFEKQ
jgi:23S rRNA pseudouridine2605 synthase